MPRTAAKAETSSDASFAGRLNAAATETEQLLDRLLAAAPADGEIARPPRVTGAMRYSSLGGGKRLRPFLAVETAALFGVKRQHALMAGAAVSSWSSSCSVSAAAALSRPANEASELVSVLVTVRDMERGIERDMG